MGLKRYVQINRGNVYDMQDARQHKAYETIKLGTPAIFGVKKTSNRLTDFIEKGDLVTSLSCFFASEVTKVTEDEVTCLLHTHWKDEITAVWKRQLNNDYKYYEVK